MIRVELIIPPSLNNAYATLPNKRRIPSKDHAAWKARAGWMLNASRCKPIPGRYTFTILVPWDMLGDVSNRIKLAEDLFVEMRLTEDDSKAVSVTCRRDKTVEHGMCIVEVREWVE